VITAIKVVLILSVLFLLTFPLLPLPVKMRRLSTAYALRYNTPHNKKNIFFTIVAVAVFIAAALVLQLFGDLIEMLYSIPFVGELLRASVEGLNSQVDFVFFAFKIVLVNLVILYAFLFLKFLFKSIVLDPAFGLTEPREKKKKEKKKKKNRKKKKKNEADEADETDEDLTEAEKTPEEIEAEREAERRRKRLRIPDFIHTEAEKDEEDDEGDKDAEDKSEAPEEKKPKPPRVRSPFEKWVLGLFFEGDEFEFAQNWVVRIRTVLQVFIYFLELIYVGIVASMLISVLFPLPMWFYDLLVNVLQLRLWYVYPVISIVFLQEICNAFKAPTREEAAAMEEHKKQEVEEERREASLRALQAELKKRFDAEHVLRYYPETINTDVQEYACTNIPYASALRYIRKQMELTSGKVVQSYMECLDAIFNEDHVYFSASFYSELGEYLIAYSYIRLLSGARLVFVVSDADEKESLKKYVAERLMRMTGSTTACSWRVYTADERLDQADIFIASPEDFRDDNIVEQYPAFFEEACNAIFIDADRSIAQDSYLCPVMASRLQKATGNRIRFVFLSLDLLKGFAAGSLPKFFCIDKVLSFSSAKENEAVSYTLWNKESKNHRIYSKHGQKLTNPECIIAELACRYGVDGVRVITESPLDHAEQKVLAMHNVEINKLYKGVADVNYMIYSDERCNLSAALYACTRFRGRKKSVVHIISKPYLLREYFMAKTGTEDYINRSSFIQPRVTEHAERYKLSLLRIFCDATSDRGMPVSEFERRMKTAIRVSKERGDIITSAYCRELCETRDVDTLKLQELAAYLISGLYDRDCGISDDEQGIRSNISARAKDFYLIIDPAKQDGYSLLREKYIIFNRVKEIFDRLFECNRRVELRLNDEVIGHLDTFPARVHLEYIAGQSIIYRNAEYEIEHIAEDGHAIYLRRENINFKNCLDTVLLRRYSIGSMEAIGDAGVLDSSQGMLSEIRVTPCKAKFSGETYGFYSIMTDRQTLDFYRGVEGNSTVDNPHVRNLSNGRFLHVTLTARMECTDGMRLLFAAAFNEFVKTIFPRAYHCIAICPILAEPLPFNEEQEAENEIDRIRALYPYIKNAEGEFIETDANRMQFLFINDCVEDVGALDWFYDRSARYMQEFLANIYSYLYWLKRRPERAHYIYFGGKSLPECYDLEGSCTLLGDYNFLLSDDGKKDFETAGDDVEDVETRRCSFCHKIMESGRFSFFDKTRFICADCFETVGDLDTLENVHDDVKDYLEKTYPDIKLGSARVRLDGVYNLTEEQLLSEFLYRVDVGARTIYVERDNPVNNVSVSVLRGLITLWQHDNRLVISYATAQLYYEELCYLRSLGRNEQADWIYQNLDAELRAKVDEIADFVKNGFQKDEELDPEEIDTDEDTDLTDEAEDDASEPNAPMDAEEDEADEEDEEDEVQPVEDVVDADGAVRTSFLFMRLKAKDLDQVDDLDRDEVVDPVDDDYSDSLYDPNRIPRFWKRYLRGERVDNDEEDDVPEPHNIDNEDDNDESEGDEDESKTMDMNNPPENCAMRFADLPTPNAPLDEDGPVLDETEQNLSEEERQKAEEDRQKRAEEEAQRRAEEDAKKRAEEHKQRVEADKKRAEEDKKRIGKWIGFLKKKGIKTVEDDKSSEETPKDDTAKKKKPTKADKKAEKEAKKAAKKAEKDAKKAEKEAKKAQKKAKKNKTDAPETPKKVKKPAAKKTKKKSTGKKRFGRLSEGERVAPYEEDEETNPRIRVYNEFVRHAYNYSEEFFSREGVSDEELSRIFTFVRCDYPELFWLGGYTFTPTQVAHSFRCKDANDRLDIKQIKQKREALRRAAKPFIKGITQNTDPYEAVLTIYRRLILTLDYDGVGLAAGIDKDFRKADPLRSLYNALVEHKVVCAGYAVAMQYLLHSVGIVCGYVVSRTDATDNCHAFNMLKIGKYCYYLDATWGDGSNTKSGTAYQDEIKYDYFCVPFNEFIRAEKSSQPMHYPRDEFYPGLERFGHTNHEYYRYHNAYLQRYDEEEIVRIIAEAAMRHDEKEMGRFIVSFRCYNGELLQYVVKSLMANGKFSKLVAQAKTKVAAQKKSAVKYLENKFDACYPNYNTGVAYFKFQVPPKKEAKKDKKKDKSK